MPAWREPHMNKAGGLTAVNTVMTSIPIHTIISLKLPEWVIHEIDKRRRGDGNLALFWKDRWNRDVSPCDIAPDLCRLEVWYAVSRLLNIQTPIPAGSLVDWWMQLRSGFNKHKRKGLDSSFMLISLSIWRERNDRVFGRSAPRSAAQIATAIIRQAQL
uniref:Reverse transcriptase zinc-binding domain-containing protein n=1 Tax=Setaria viridis TaxID=4556 RepID=A0A4U6SPV7_SETVI|nr:hypothetical protein SEVIR_9G032200v2 [Setaria viridis]